MNDPNRGGCCVADACNLLLAALCVRALCARMLRIVTHSVEAIRHKCPPCFTVDQCLLLHFCAGYAFSSMRSAMLLNYVAEQPDANMCHMSTNAIENLRVHWKA